MNNPQTDTRPYDSAALAEWAFASGKSGEHLSRSLTWMPPEELELDLSDPDQRRFGDYQLIELLGRGGMGVVYRAQQTSLQRDVALKLLSAGPWASEEFIARFHREARSAARMQHPNIVEVYEIGQREGLHFFSMRLVDGESLASWVRSHPQPDPRQVATLLRAIAEAVDYAHRLGVLHLDLKPGNVLIDRQGTPLVADFGLARQVDHGHTGEVEEISGTPSYMAPEQAVLKSHPLSAATDIYGLGAILYELLCGQPPFQGPNPRITLEQVVHCTPTPPSARHPAVPADLEAICLKCLHKQPGDRYPSARALADDLQRFLEGRAVSARRQSRLERGWRWMRREPLLAVTSLGLALSLLLGLLVSQWQSQRIQAAFAEAEVERAAAQASARHSGQLSRLLAVIYPPGEADPTAPPPANAAVDWLLREVPDDGEQAELLRALTSELLAAGKADAADTLLWHIHVRLSERLRQDVVQTLAARGSDADQQAAAWMGLTLKSGPVRQLGGQLAAAALAAAPDDPWRLHRLARYCAGERADCPTADALTRLIAAEPDNLFGLALLGATTKDAGERRELLRRGAQTAHYNDRIGAIILELLNAFERSDLPVPQALARPSAALGLRQDSRNVVAYVSGWAMPRSPLAWMEEACRPSHFAANDPTLRQDCLRIGRLLAEGIGEEVSHNYGWRILHRLGPSPEVAEEIRQDLRRQRWRLEQGAWSLARDPALGAEQFLRELAELGETEADGRRLDRLGIAREPPADWQPSDPKALELSE